MPVVQCRAFFIAAFMLAHATARADAIDTMSDQTLHGRYAQAFKTAESHLNATRILGQPSRNWFSFYVYLSRLNVEVGLFPPAVEALSEAESIREANWESMQATLHRERASLYIATSEFPKAAQSAAQACRLAKHAGHYRIRIAYCQALWATALLRLGNLAEAQKAFSNALESVPKNPAKNPLFGPRILYAASLIQSYEGNHAKARELCQRALDSLRKAGLKTRDIPLGQLTLAEVELGAGNLDASRTAALESVETSKSMFGSAHQDSAAAFELLARVELRHGDVAEARRYAIEAVRIADAVFGRGTPGTAPSHRVLRATGN